MEKLTHGLKQREGKVTESRRDRWTTREYLRGCERQKKDVYICSSMQSAHVCVPKPSVIYSRQKWWMHPFSVPTLQSSHHSSFDRPQTTSLFRAFVVLKMNAIKNKCGAVSINLVRSESGERCGAKIRRTLFFNCNSFWGIKELLINVTAGVQQWVKFHTSFLWGRGETLACARNMAPGRFSIYWLESFLHLEVTKGCSADKVSLQQVWLHALGELVGGQCAKAKYY